MFYSSFFVLNVMLWTFAHGVAVGIHGQEIADGTVPTPTREWTLTTPGPSLELLARQIVNRPWAYINGDSGQFIQRSQDRFAASLF